jgi:hypothetical protein
LAADRFRHVDIFDPGRAAESREHGFDHLAKAPRLPGPDIEQTGDARGLEQPAHDGHHVIDMDEVAPLVAVGDALAMRFEQPHGLARLGLVEYTGQHARHLALVVFIGAEDVEEFQPRPLRRQFFAPDLAGDEGLVEEMLAPSVEVHRPQRTQMLWPIIVGKALLGVAIGRRRGGIDEGSRGGRTPVQ